MEDRLPRSWCLRWVPIYYRKLALPGATEGSHFGQIFSHLRSSSKSFSSPSTFWEKNGQEFFGTESQIKEFLKGPPIKAKNKLTKAAPLKNFGPSWPHTIFFSTPKSWWNRSVAQTVQYFWIFSISIIVKPSKALFPSCSGVERIPKVRPRTNSGGESFVASEYEQKAI